MAFGKVTVRSESGDVEEFELTKPTSSVGRQPGNDIVLKTSAVSRYHAQFDVAEGRVFLVDLGTVNGTFVNDVQLEPNGRIMLNDGDVIQMGDMMLVFSLPEAPGRASISLTPVVAPVEEPGLPFRLLLDEPQQSVAPGARLQLALTIENLSDEEQDFIIDVGGLNRDWISVNRREATVEAHEDTEVLISLRPPRHSQTNPGRYALTVRVAFRHDPNRGLQAVREIDVVGYTGLGVAVRPSSRNGVYRIAVQNQGNVPIDVRLGGFDREHALAYRYNPPQLHIQPGQTGQASLAVHPRRGPFFGATTPVTFAVVVRSLDAAGYQAPVLATYTPDSSSWWLWLAGAILPLGLGAMLILLAVIAGLAFLGVLPLPGFRPEAAVTLPPSETAAASTVVYQPDPSLVPTPAADILDFSVQPNPVIYRTTGEVVFTWRMVNATRVELFDSAGQPVILSANDLSTGQHRYPAQLLTWGDHVFTLTVTGEDGQQRSRSVVVTVRSVICRAVSQDVPIYTLPDLNSPLAPPLDARDLAITGRSTDSLWVQVAYNDLQTFTMQGWLPADWVSCPTGSPSVGEYVALEQTSFEQVTPSPETASTPSP